jgi:hypothetical protein
MSLTTPSKIRELQIKLYRKAKSEFRVQSRSTRHFSDEVNPVRESRGEASRKAGCGKSARPV